MLLIILLELKFVLKITISNLLTNICYIYFKYMFDISLL